MANIPDSSLKTWKDGDVVHASDYSQDRSILQAGINDNYSKIQTDEANITALQTKTSKIATDGSDFTGTWHNMAPSQIASSTVNWYYKSWTATDNQSVFQLTGPDALYTPGAETTWVEVGGVPQAVGQGYSETNSSTITLAEGVPAGTLVELRYFLNNAASETPINKMVGYQENVATPFYEATGDGVISGLGVTAQATPNMTVAVASGIIHMPDGTRYAPTSSTVTIAASDATKPRKDLVYVDNTGAINYLESALGTAAVAGSDTYTITTNAVANDTVVIDGVTFTAVSATPTGNQFLVGATTTDTATNLASVLNGNATINATYTASSSTNVVTLTEKTAGGGHTPSAATTTGTIVISSGTPTTSAAQVYPSAPATPSGGLALAQVSVSSGATSITSSNITDERLIKQNNNQLSSQLADIARLKLKHTYGAIGDGNTHPLSSQYSTLSEAQVKYPCATALTDEIDWCAIQQMYNDAPQFSTVYIPTPSVRYRINKTLVFNKTFVDVKGDNKGVEIRHYGNGSGIKYTVWDWSLENIFITGDGTNQLNADGVTYSYGVGASSQYGIELDGSSGGVNRFSMKNVKSSYHASYGVYCHSGVWIGLFEDCELFYNGLDGINAVNVGTDQNGNNFTFIGGSYSSNGRDGIQWGAANGTFLNIDAENNSKGGLCINGGIGANIIGGYLENNHEEQLRLDTTTASVSYSMKGTYLNSNFAGTGAGNSLIKAIGTNGITQSIEDVVWSIAGAVLTYYADFNNQPTLGSTIKYTENYGAFTGKFINLGKMKIILSPRDIGLIGKFDAKGNITFTNNNLSDNFFGVGTKTVEFRTPLTKGDMITQINMYLVTDSTSQITVTATINEIYFSGGNTTTTLTANITGSGTVTLTPSSPIYLDQLSAITLSLSITNPATGTNLQIGNPMIKVA